MTRHHTSTMVSSVATMRAGHDWDCARGHDWDSVPGHDWD